jgi:hypothetical protein
VYLAKKSGRLIPGDPAGEAQVVRWCFAAMNSVEPPLLSLMVLDWTADGSCGKYREFLVGWVNRVLANLERWFADREFVATNDFTVADILMAHVLSAGAKDEGLIAPYPAVAAYRDRCLARPAWKRTIEAYCARLAGGVAGDQPAGLLCEVHKNRGGFGQHQPVVVDRRDLFEGAEPAIGVGVEVVRGVVHGRQLERQLHLVERPQHAQVAGVPSRDGVDL